MNRPRKKSEGRQKDFAEKLEAQNSALQKILKAIKEKFNGKNGEHKNHQMIFSFSVFLSSMLLFCLPSFAQNSPSALASSGECTEISGVSLEWTLGEAIINSYSSGGNTISQGFHQAGLLITSSHGIASPEMQLYPNPFTQSLHLNLSGKSLPAEAQILDVSGKLKISYSLNQTQNSLNLKSLKPGLYFLRLTLQNKNETIKIIKQ